MNKQEFLDALRKELCGLPKEATEERLAFYSEMIDDRIEEGVSEEEAVAFLGNTNEIAKQIVAQTPLIKIAKEKFKTKNRFSVLEILLLILGSPIWLTIGISLIAVILSVYISLWSAIISLWAVFVSLVASALGGVLAGIGFAFFGNISTGIAMICAGMIVAGFSILMFFSAKVATKGILILTKKFAIFIKNVMAKKEAV